MLKFIVKISNYFEHKFIESIFIIKNIGGYPLHYKGLKDVGVHIERNKSIVKLVTANIICGKYFTHCRVEKCRKHVSIYTWLP